MGDFELPIAESFNGMAKILLWLNEKQSLETKLEVTPFIGDKVKDDPKGANFNSKLQMYVEIVRNRPKRSPAILVIISAVTVLHRKIVFQ